MNGTGAGVSAGEILILLAAVAVLSEALTQRTKEILEALFKGKPTPRMDVALSVFWGLVLAFVWRVDCLRIMGDLTGFPSLAPWWIGVAISGLLGSRLANIFHDLASRAEAKAAPALEDVKPLG